jgi:branched-chain amino acid transport system permease protein
MNKKIGYLIAAGLALAAPFVGYPVFLMKLLCFALFACAFNLLIGFTGLLSFGHAAFFGAAGYVAGYALTTGAAGRARHLLAAWPAARCSAW